MLAFLAMAIMQSPGDPATWGREALEAIRRDYWMPESKLYSERPDRKQPAFNWGVGVMLSALAAAAKHDAAYKPRLREYVDASRVYWNDGGYDVLPAPKPKDRYYDDNAWMALALAEAGEVLGDVKVLGWAKEALDFALSGEAADGGIYWRESDRASRNTCACAPTAAACLTLASSDPDLFERARRIVDWTRKNLEDPSDGLYWDSISNGGKLDRTKWTYNTALMIRAAVDLGERELAQRMVTASRKRWLRERRLDDPGRFAHLLLEAWIKSGVDPAEMLPILQAVKDAQSKSGRYPAHWSKLEVDENAELLDQAAFARACFVVANAMKR